jgi:hypothetical protein
MYFFLSLAMAGEAPDITGTWRLNLTVATKVQVPVIGGLSNWTITSMLVTIQSGPEGLIQRQQICRITIGSRPELAKTVIPPAFIRAMPIRSFPVSLVETPEGWNFLMDPGPLSVGFAAGSPIPTSLDAPGILDFDGDGQPGATVQVEVPLIGLKGDVWVVQNGHTIMRGNEVSTSEIRGRADVVFLEQHTLGATHPWLTSNPKVTQDPSNSHFEMERVATGAVCGDN